MNKLKAICFLLVSIVSVSRGQKVFDLIQSDDPVKVSEVVKEAENYFSKAGQENNSGYKLYERWLDWATRSMDANGYTITSKQAYEERQKFDNTFKNNKMAFNGDWKELGPKEWTLASSWSAGLGRIVSMAVEPNNQQLMYVGSPGGGLWKSVNAGLSWVPLTDQANMSIWSIAIDPIDNNKVYVGNTSGLIKSSDGGITWVSATGSQGTPRRILIHPTNTNQIWAASTSGIFYSSNSGLTFSKVSALSTEDIDFKPGDPSTMYACGNDFQLSTDGGLTWTKITSGIIAAERMRMDVTPAAPQNIYLLQKKGSGFGRIYRSVDSGNSFSIMCDIANSGTPNYLGSQASRNMGIAVSNTNANEVHIGGLDYYRSMDGGATFTKLCAWNSPGSSSYVHADIEFMNYVNGKIYVGSDGGIFRSSNQGNTMTDLTQNGVGVRQYYRIGGYPADANLVGGGSQDNGTSIMKGSSHEFVEWLGADGMETFIDYTNPNILYGTSQYGTLYKSTNGGSSRNTLSGPGDGKGEWETPFEMDPIDHNTIYVGYEELFRSRTAAASGSWVSLTDSVPLVDDLDEVKIAPSNNDYIYIAENASMWRTKNGQEDPPLWTSITGFTGTVNYIAIDPDDPEHVAIATSGSRIYVTSNAGDTWTEISGNVPNVSHFCVAYDDLPENGLYVGTSSGVYYTTNDQITWTPFSTNLPKVEVRELDIHFGSRKIRAGTYGRGIWESTIVDPNVPLNTYAVNKEDNSKVTLYPNPVTDVLNFKIDRDLNLESVTVINAIGKEVMQIDKPVGSIDLSQLSKGIYLMQLNSGGQRITKRIIIK
ncbi:MAG: T9SS type A sorting domain-containing protein [Bacteroidetes bacterium]|nr:T9SS type A sorting domain-containing protein [Bacteroidota bacterium]